MHTHVVPQGWPDLALECGGAGWPWLKIESEREAIIMIRDTEFRPIDSSCWDPAVRLADMDADGVWRQVVSPTPVFFGYDRAPSQAVALSRIFNSVSAIAAGPLLSRIASARNARVSCVRIARFLNSTSW